MKVYGHIIDNQTRCKHYATDKDIIAIKFKCCNKYYPCYKCHNECESHTISVWNKEEFNELAILCGVCKTEQPINLYMDNGKCINCNSIFNDGCKKHYHLYFEFKNIC